MRTKVLKTISENEMIAPGDRVLVAYSGGSDSTALLHLLFSLAPALKIELFAAHVNHRIREDAAPRDEAFAKDFAELFGIPFFSTEIDVPLIARESGEGIEEAARRLRYGYLEETANSFGCTRIATAHTRDDSLESILLNIIRGCGPGGLLGIPPKRGKIIRPLILISKEEVLSYLSENRLPFVKDASNDDISYARNRIRHKIIPEMRAINPSVSYAVSRMSEIIRADVTHIDREAEEVYFASVRSRSPLSLAVSVLKCAPPAVACRVLRRACREVSGLELSETRTKAVYSLLSGTSPSARIQLKSGYEAVKNYDIIVFGNNFKVPPAPTPAPLILGERTVYNGLSIYVENVPEAGEQEESVYYLKDSLSALPLKVRPRLPGDYIALNGKPGRRSLSRLFIDMKIPKDKRGFLPVLTAGGDVVAVYPYGPSKRHMAAPGESALRVSIIPICKPV